MWYLFGILYFAIGLAIGVVELRERQEYLPNDSNKAWWCIPVFLFFWLPILIIILISFLIHKIKKP